ncbi:MAG: ThuA domain-containing protein [Verrucomicrobiota bacterium]
MACWAIVLIPGFSPAQEIKKLYEGDPIKALLITGGCCHNYLLQTAKLTHGTEAFADVEWTIVNEGGKGTKAQIELYDDPDWAKPYDVVVHNECFANTADPDYIRKITKGHQAGVPAVVIHCAMHTYRAAKIDDWRQFLGVTSRHHEHQSKYPVKIVDEEHPTMKGFPKDWVTPKDELYIVEKLWPKARTLATSVSEKTGEEQTVVWVNDFHGTRVFGTTYGHSDDTFRDPVFINLLARGLVWAADKGGAKPTARIYGEVQSPGLVALSDRANSLSLQEVVSRAGGFTGSAGAARVELLQNGVRKVIDLTETTDPSIRVQAGDIIYVPQRFSD